MVGHDTIVPTMWPIPGRQADAVPEVPYLAYSAESGLGRIIAATRGLQPSSSLLFTPHLAAVLRTMALDGRGIAWLPLSLIKGDIERGLLTRIGPADWPIPIDIRLFRPRARQSPAAETFWKRLEEQRRGGAAKREAS